MSLQADKVLSCFMRYIDRMLAVISRIGGKRVLYRELVS